MPTEQGHNYVNLAKPLMSLPYPLQSKGKPTLFSERESSCERVSSSSNNLRSA